MASLDYPIFQVWIPFMMKLSENMAAGPCDAKEIAFLLIWNDAICILACEERTVLCAYALFDPCFCKSVNGRQLHHVKEMQFSPRYFTFFTCIAFKEEPQMY